MVCMQLKYLFNRCGNIVNEFILLHLPVELLPWLAGQNLIQSSFPLSGWWIHMALTMMKMEWNGLMQPVILRVYNKNFRPTSQNFEANIPIYCITGRWVCEHNLCSLNQQMLLLSYVKKAFLLYTPWQWIVCQYKPHQVVRQIWRSTIESMVCWWKHCKCRNVS